MEDFVFLDDIGAINFALKVEADEFNLYRNLASEKADTNVKALCEEFMGWEQMHIEHLKKLMKAGATSSRSYCSKRDKIRAGRGRDRAGTAAITVCTFLH